MLISYIRVSTQKQGDSGLGLEAQQQAIDAIANARNEAILREYREVESGKRSDRPQLRLAIAHAKRLRATLVIAKLDRLARNLNFLTSIMDSGCEFVACDNPHANRLTLHILGAVAEDEAKRISERTKAALAAAKRRGTLLGSARPGHWAGREQARLRGALKGAKISARARLDRSMKAIADLIPIMQARQAEGYSLHGIAEILNAEGHLTTQGHTWNATAVCRALKRVS